MIQEKKIQDYLHYYLGCGVMAGYFEATLCSVGILGNDNQKYRILVGGKSATQPFSIASDKLILRRLDDMTEEEREELWKLIFVKEFPLNGRTVFFNEKTLTADPRHVMLSGLRRLGIEMNGTVWADEDLQLHKHNQHEITRWFLSKHFDLFGLIDAGLAIDQKSLTNKI